MPTEHTPALITTSGALQTRQYCDNASTRARMDGQVPADLALTTTLAWLGPTASRVRLSDGSYKEQFCHQMRMVDQNHLYYFCLRFDTYEAEILIKTAPVGVDGAYRKLKGNRLTSFTLDPGRRVTFRTETRGQTLKLLVNGEPICEYVDEANTFPIGSAGIRVDNARVMFRTVWEELPPDA